MASILFYTPFDQRSRDVESLMLAFHQQGHRVISLSQQKGSMIHEFLRSQGIEVHSHVIQSTSANWWYFFRHLIFFVRFCRREKIDIVYSHLEPANYVASIGQFFIRAKTIICRHHIDEGGLYGFDQALYYKITYRLAKKIIVESDHARRYMMEHENIPGSKILHINLAYDFSLYPVPVEEKVKQLRREYPCTTLLLSVCRLTAYKRPDASVRVMKKLIDQGFDARLIILGRGEMFESLSKLASELGIAERVHVLGHVPNVIDYMAAADFFVHPSLLDSSSIAVKEAGLLRKPVIVCQGVGDFDDYIVHNTNGFRVAQKNFDDEAAAVIAGNYNDTVTLSRVGENLNLDVIRLFSIQNIVSKYDSLNDTND